MCCKCCLLSASVLSAESLPLYPVLIVYSLLCGAATGLMYDIFKIPRMPVRALGNVKFYYVTVFICDILFSLCAAACFAILVFHANYGKIRWFAALFTAAGFYAERITAGRLFSKCASYLYDFCCRAGGAFIKTAVKILCAVIYPVRMVLDLLFAVMFGIFYPAYRRCMEFYLKSEWLKISDFGSAGMNIRKETDRRLQKAGYMKKTETKPERKLKGMRKSKNAVKEKNKNSR